MKVTLLQKLDLGSLDASQRLAGLLEEDPEVKRERSELQTRIGRLENVLVELRGFGV